MNEKNFQPNLEELERLLKKNSQMNSARMFHMATPEHNPTKIKGIGYTRKSHSESHAKRYNAKLQRRINRKIANKKFRPTGSKKRK